MRLCFQERAKTLLEKLAECLFAVVFRERGVENMLGGLIVSGEPLVFAPVGEHHAFLAVLELDQEGSDDEDELWVWFDTWFSSGIRLRRSVSIPKYNKPFFETPLKAHQLCP